MPWVLLEAVDFLGTVAFAISGALVGISRNMDLFGVELLAVTTACGGGLLRDLMADRIPDICVKHVYALAALLGATVMALMLKFTDRVTVSMLLGFATVLLTRILAVRFDWNLPRVERRKGED